MKNRIQPPSPPSPALLSRAPRGFTLIELLVVVAIVGLLLALLMPAVQAARESARVVECKGKLREIAKGLHHYHSARKRFPGGVVLKPQGPCLGGETRDGINWMISILPYIEEQPLFNLYDDRQYNEAPVNEPVRTANVALYSCPSDPHRGLLIVPEAGPVAKQAQLKYRTGSYRGVSGFSKGMSFLDSNNAHNYPLNYRGVLHAVGVGVENFHPERFTTIADGTAHTMMVGESITRSLPEWQTMWAYSYNFYSLSAITDRQPRTLGGDYERCVLGTWGMGGAEPCKRGWGSDHPRLMNFSFIDGSVRSIVDTIDIDVLARLATIAGEETGAKLE